MHLLRNLVVGMIDFSGVAIYDTNSPVGARGHHGIMRGDDKGLSRLGTQVRNQLEHVFPVTRIEIAFICSSPPDFLSCLEGKSGAKMSGAQ